MSAIDSRGRVPQDIVAIFHASFHPTKGNLVDWSLKASDDLDLNGVEFSTLPSGLHLVDQDVVYFTKESHSGVCVFRRRKTTEHGQRGFRLSSLGILLVKSARPRAWRHVAALRNLIDSIYSSLEQRSVLEPSEGDWDPAREFFEDRKVRRADLGGAGDWHGWSLELDNPDIGYSPSNPTPHLAHLLRILGPSALTVYKHVLGRRRILIYTLPPVEAACILCQVAADICFEAQLDSSLHSAGGEVDPAAWYRTRLKGKSKEGINVLGMVTLNDLDKMHHEGKSGRGWIACTTDAIFLEKPSYYDLVIDLTTSTPSKASRPTLYLSKPQQQQAGSRGPSHRLSVVRFTWSDVKLWNELERILQLDGDQCNHECCRPGTEFDGRAKSPSSWTDAWRIYEDVCIVCAGLWMGSWRSNSTMSYSTGNGSMANWGSVRLEGDDDLSLGGAFVRNVGMGIEGRPSGSPNMKGMRRSSAMSWSGGNAGFPGPDRRQASTSTAFTSSSEPRSEPGGNDADINARRDRQVMTTLALLQTFHANTCFQLSRLAALLPTPPNFSSGGSAATAEPDTIYITPKDIVSFELGPLSSLDARYLEWLAEEYGGGTRIEVKRGWKDLFGVIFGFG
ncbi:hypothetical protein BV22DRAFT_1194947 [Leucogyrophana mollusca]|uniref:Uncharacterized protein n=1 Tax=Leucogyrophana mollusca TaxID=85980 RepID=A0ACB8BLK6_9AGAM|nr:hypothetical protein BV22DRAFT_1194947 [Leucogyrophana mollusca]